MTIMTQSWVYLSWYFKYAVSCDHIWGGCAHILVIQGIDEHGDLGHGRVFMYEVDPILLRF